MFGAAVEVRERERRELDQTMQIVQQHQEELPVVATVPIDTSSDTSDCKSTVESSAELVEELSFSSALIISAVLSLFTLTA